VQGRALRPGVKPVRSAEAEHIWRMVSHVPGHATTIEELRYWLRVRADRQAVFEACVAELVSRGDVEWCRRMDADGVWRDALREVW
jgi:hypothetical protein